MINEMSQRYGWKEVLKPYMEDLIKAKKDEVLTYDPFKDPGKISRLQGEINGLQKILSYVNKRSG